MAIYADFRFDWFVIDTSFGTISPEFRNDLGTRINDILPMGAMADGTSYVAVLNDEGISILYASGLELAKIPDAAGATALTAYGDSVIWSDNGSNGPKLGIFSVSSETRQDIFVNASASDETESGLMDAGSSLTQLTAQLPRYQQIQHLSQQLLMLVRYDVSYLSTGWLEIPLSYPNRLGMHGALILQEIG